MKNSFLLQAGGTEAVPQGGRRRSVLEGLPERLSLLQSPPDPCLFKLLPSLFHFQQITCHSTGRRRQSLSLSLGNFMPISVAQVVTQLSWIVLFSITWSRQKQAVFSCSALIAACSLWGEKSVIIDLIGTSAHRCNGDKCHS